MTPAELTAWVVETIDSNPLLKTIYFEAVDATTMQRVDGWDASTRVQGCCAVQAGDIRLIDNIRIK
jgi:pantoate--beta-alanine ligase